MEESTFKKQLCDTLYEIFNDNINHWNKRILDMVKESSGNLNLTIIIDNISIARAMEDYYSACGLNTLLETNGKSYKLTLTMKDWYKNS